MKSEELRRKAQNDWITLEKGQYPLNIAVQKLQMQQSDIRVKIMDINDGYERWKKIRTICVVKGLLNNALAGGALTATGR